jgi:small subunit ribosomal protein S16
MVKIRLARRGRKKLAIYDIVVADAKAPRDGRFVEKIGTYNPNLSPAGVVLKEDRAFYWVMVGAQPTDTVKAMLSVRGVLFKKHLQVGVNKGAITQEQADAKFNAWKDGKVKKAENRVADLGNAKVANKKAALEAETKVKEAKAAAIKKKYEVVAPVVEAPAAETEAETTES